MEYREVKKLINWPRNGLTESLLTKLLAFPLLWFKKSSEVIGERNVSKCGKWATVK